MANALVPDRRVMTGPALLARYFARAIRSHIRAPAMQNSTGRRRMIVPRHQRWMVPVLALLILTLSISVWADGFPGGVREALGPLFDAAPPSHVAPSLHSPREWPDAMQRLRHWHDMAMDATGLDHTPV